MCLVRGQASPHKCVSGSTRKLARLVEQFVKSFARRCAGHSARRMFAPPKARDLQVSNFQSNIHPIIRGNFAHAHGGKCVALIRRTIFLSRLCGVDISEEPQSPRWLLLDHSRATLVLVPI